MTAHGGDQMATQAVNEGAFGFLRKPVADADLAVTVARAADSRRMRQTLGSYDGLGSLVGRSPAMRRLFQAVRVMAGADLSVLLLGESGTGKTEVARRIHEGSRRLDKPFVELNCASFVEHLAESELFGHEKGAFTGATETKAGRIAAAEGGTLFLDEVGDMSLTVQARLLSFLQSRRYRRLGSNQEHEADVRVLAATNKDLAAEIKKGTFREDLYFRLCVEALRVPALRERPEDIHPLSMHFLQKYPRPRVGPVVHLRPEVLVALTSYRWPGNVRELENVIRRGVVYTAGDTLGLEALPEEVLGRAEPEALPVPDRLRFPDKLLVAPFQEAKAAVLEAFEEAYLRALLQRAKNKSQAAVLAGLERSNFNRLLRRRRPDDDASEP
jgi:two-component system response regulator HydG